MLRWLHHKNFQHQKPQHKNMVAQGRKAGSPVSSCPIIHDKCGSHENVAAFFFDRHVGRQHALTGQKDMEKKVYPIDLESDMIKPVDGLKCK
jgi:hypothetical protein